MSLVERTADAEDQVVAATLAEEALQDPLPVRRAVAAVLAVVAVAVAVVAAAADEVVGVTLELLPTSSMSASSAQSSVSWPNAQRKRRCSGCRRC